MEQGPLQVLVFKRRRLRAAVERLDNGKLQSPKDKKEVHTLSQQELCWILEGLPSNSRRLSNPPRKVHFEFYRALIWLYSGIRTRYNSGNKTERNVVILVGTSDENSNWTEHIIRLLEEQLAHSNQQNKELAKQIEILNE